MSGVSRFRVMTGKEVGRLPPLRGRNQTTLVIAIAPRAAAMIAPFLCCLILLTMYSALDDEGVDGPEVCRPGVRALPDDGNVVSVSPAPLSRSPICFSSRATSLIV